MVDGKWGALTRELYVLSDRSEVYVGKDDGYSWRGGQWVKDRLGTDNPERMAILLSFRPLPVFCLFCVFFLLFD